MKYKPQLAKSRSWEEIEKKYSELIGLGLNFHPMLNLVKHVLKTNLHKRLYAYTSMHKLVISIYDEIEWNREALHIEFDSETRVWFYTYRSKPGSPIAFERKYSEDLGIKKLDQFIKNVNW